MSRGLAPLERFCAAPHAVPTSTLVVVAHPDDEIIGAGGRLSFLIDPTIVHVTDGAPRDGRDARAAGFSSREAYARRRRDEVAAALALVGLDSSRTRELRVVDQEAALHLVPLARELAGIVAEVRPELVLTHAYEGGHPDHDATAFAVHAAVDLIEREGGRRPALAEFPSYHGGNGEMSLLEFLPAEGREAVTVELDPEARALKAAMFACHSTQLRTLGAFPLHVERFREAPRYDFCRSPHPGVPLYERFPWGMTFRRWGALADDALEELRAPP